MKLKDRIKGLERIPARDLLPHPRNWRTHPREQRDALRGILAEVGIADALLVRETPDGYQILDGHCRAEEAPDVEWPCLVVDLSDAEAEKLLVTHDPIGAMAEADADTLRELLAGVESDSEAVQKLLGALGEECGIVPALGEPPEDPGAQVDRAEELRAEWSVERGQVWQAGRHRIMCGDSTCAEDVERLLGGEKPRLMVTDPPYGVEYDPNWRKEAADKGLLSHAARRVGNVQNDDRADWSPVFVLWPSVVAYTWCSSLHLATTGESLRAASYHLRSLLVWAKPRFPISRGDYHWQHETCWYAVKKGQKSGWIGDRSQTTLWQIALDQTVEGGHPTQKPVECMRRPIRNHEGDVCDPFLGSGTTLVACEQLGRVGYGMEISPAYVAVSLQRLHDMGLTCEVVSDGNA